MSENGEYEEIQAPEHDSFETRIKEEDEVVSRSPSPVKSVRSDRKSKSISRSRSRSGSRSYNKRRRKRSYSRSRSRSRSYHSKRSRRSRSRSRGYDRRERRERSRSRSPMSSRRRHFGNRDDPEPSKCLGIFGLSLYTQERDLREVFGRYGYLEECNVVYDRQSGRSRGFAFLYFRSIDDAIEAKDRCSGIEIDGRRIRVDYSITKRAHTPTPGIYLGKPSGRESREGRDYDRGGYGGGGRRRSPSPYYGRRGRYSYSRSRSRSYSPHRPYYSNR